MASLNRCEFIGNLGQDPEVKYGNSGDAIATLSIACSESWKDKNTGQKQEKTEWIRVVAFGKLAEIMGEYLHKGSKVYVAGKMVTRKWQDNDGKDKYTTEVVAREMVMLDSAQGNQGGQGGGQQNRGAPQQNRGQQQQRAPANQQQQGQVDDFDDDIPFR